MDEVRQRILNSHARGYVAMHTVLKYDDILAHAAKEYGTDEERDFFRDAVLHEEIVRSNQEPPPRYPGAPR